MPKKLSAAIERIETVKLGTAAAGIVFQRPGSDLAHEHGPR